jgi:NAD+ kinase
MALPRLGFVVSKRPDVGEVVGRLHEAASARGFDTTDVAPGAGTDCDVVVGVGGDGTLLEAAAVAHGADIPVVGVNLGTVGYLTEFEPDQIDLLLATLASDPLPVRGRMTLRAETEDGRAWHGINDVVVEKVVSRRIVRLAVTIDGEYFTTYRADGIIVATPLGSTAYSLSVGGPVLTPELEAMVLSPVAPHSLLSRSLVLAPQTVVEIVVAADRPVQVNVDGVDACRLGERDRLVVRSGERPVWFVSLGHNPFPQGVRKQFGIDHA